MNLPKNHHKEWTEKEINYIRESARKGVTTKNIAKILERTEDAVRKKASEEKITLLPRD